MKDVILSIYLSIYLPVCASIYLFIYLFVRPFVRLYSYWNWAPSHPIHNTHPYPYPMLPLSLLKLDETTQGRNDPGLKRLAYFCRNDPPQKLAETTQAETTRIPFRC